MAKTNYDNFDRFAVDYRDIHSENVKLSGADSDYFSEYKVREIALREQASSVQNVLDLGCGDGNSVNYFRHYFPESHIDGIDISQVSVDVAVARGITDATFKVYDGARIPYPDGVFDVCLIATVLHHIPHRLHAALLREVHRVLRPGGRLYIFEHNPYNPVTRHIVNTCPFDINAVLLRPGVTLRTTQSAGFTNVANRFTLFLPRSRMFRLFLRLEKYLGWLPLGAQYYTRGEK